MTPAQTIISFAKQREHAYLAYGCLQGEKMAAISKIKKTASIFSKTQKTGWIRQIKNEIITILPEDGKAKEKIEKLLNKID